MFAVRLLGRREFSHCYFNNFTMSLLNFQKEHGKHNTSNVYENKDKVPAQSPKLFLAVSYLFGAPFFHLQTRKSKHTLTMRSCNKCKHCMLPSPHVAGHAHKSTRLLLNLPPPSGRIYFHFTPDFIWKTTFVSADSAYCSQFLLLQIRK